MEHERYPYWGMCDVEGCEEENANGGGCWRETGYWQVCMNHADMYREGKPQPPMKVMALKRESLRDPVTGYLPINAEQEENTNGNV